MKIRNSIVVVFMLAMLVLLLGLGYLTSHPIEKEVTVYKNVTIPCPEQDCRLEVLQAKLDCKEEITKPKDVTPSVDCEEESLKPQWCNGFKCPSNQYCERPAKAINGVCVDRKC